MKPPKKRRAGMWTGIQAALVMLGVSLNMAVAAEKQPLLPAVEVEEGVFFEVSTNACPATVIGRIQVASTKKHSADDLAADLAKGNMFVPDPHFVTGLAWTGGNLGIYNKVDH